MLKSALDIALEKAKMPYDSKLTTTYEDDDIQVLRDEDGNGIVINKNDIVQVTIVD